MLDYSRLTRCLKEVNKLWQDARPPKGVDNCKDCALLTRVIDFENGLNSDNARLFDMDLTFRNYLRTQDYYRKLTRRSVEDIEAILNENTWDPDGGMWINWDFN